MKTKIAFFIVVVLVFAVLTACQPGNDGTPLDEVAIQLKWVHQAQFAGYYLAETRGYYADEGIDVVFIEGGPSIDIGQEISSGKVEFGVIAPEQILLHRSHGAPLVAIATIYQNNPMAFITLADSGISQPTDFLGRVAGIEGSDGELQFRAMMNRLDLDINRVEILPYEYDYESFYNGDVDITVAYSTGGIIRIRQAYHEINLIWPGDYGVHMYSDTLITTEQMIAENPDLVTRFLRATLRGWREAIEEPDAAVEITLEYVLDADAEMQAQMMNASIPLVHAGDDQIGWMSADVWEGMHTILLEQGLLEKPIDLDTIYSMKFLQQVYGAQE